MQVESSSDNTYNAIKEDPRLLLLLINKFVKVELIKNIEICGFIHSIDPIGHSIIILEPKGDNFQTTIIPGHAVLNVLEQSSEETKQPPVRKVATSSTQICFQERKNKIISWFKQNLLPVSESGENIAFGSVLILPPYSITDICTDNPLVAMQVKTILNQMPESF